LKKLRGGEALRVPLREQILDALADGEMKTAELVEAIDGYPTTIKNKLRQLVDAGEIVKVKRAVYARKAE
jgi:DNA-binding transcriptional ArsR family regulator